MLMPAVVLSSARDRFQTSSSCYSWLLLLQILLLAVVLLAVPSSGFYLARITTSEGTKVGAAVATRETIPGRFKNYRNKQKKTTTTCGGSPSSSSTLFLLFSSSQNPETTDQDPVLRLPLMEAELATLLEDDNNKRESLNSIQRQEELQELISNAKTAAEFGVRKAQLEFYDAFSRGDIHAMDNVWSTQSHVRCVHPGMVSLDGRDKVMASWRQIFQASSSDDVGVGVGGDDDDDDSSSFEIEPVRSQVEVHGLIALCSCVEKTEGGGSLEALNVYKREEGAWKMTLHMASPTMVSIRGGDSGGGAFF